MKLVLDSLDDFTNNKVLVHKDEEESFEQGISIQKVVPRQPQKDLANELAKELSLVKDVIVHFSKFLEHLQVCATFRKGIFPENFSDLGKHIIASLRTTPVDYRSQTFRLRFALLLNDREVKAFFVERIDKLFGHFY